MKRASSDPLEDLAGMLGTSMKISSLVEASRSR